MKYIELAAQIRKELGLEEVPTDVYKIADKLGLEIKKEILENDISGFLLTIKSKKSYIVINKRHSSNRQRFSIAHEIAHFLLHKNSADVFVNNAKATFRDSNSSTGEYRQEVQANRFAAELLMPKKELREAFQERYYDLHSNEAEDIIQKLAEDFQVSISAMTIRLNDLNLLYNSF